MEVVEGQDQNLCIELQEYNQIIITEARVILKVKRNNLTIIEYTL